MRLIVAPWIVRLITGVQARWVGGGPEAKQRIYYGNHTSNLDFLIIWSILPTDLRANTRPIAAHDYWTANPIRRFLAEKVFNAVLIERKKVSRSNNPLGLMNQALEGGASLIIFPEGTRKRGDEPGLMPFKSGLAHLVEKFPDVEVVPVFMHNMNRILPAGDILFVPLLCSVTVGAPLKMEPEEKRDAFLTRARLALESLEAL